MEAKISLLEQHVAKLESLYFPTPVTIPDPPIRPEDHIDPALIQMIKDKNLEGFSGARRVPADYYEKELEYRRNCVGAQKIDQLCKCVLFDIPDAPNPLNRYVCVVVQYIDRISSNKLCHAISQLFNTKIKNDFSVADEKEAAKLSGSQFNAMTPVLLRPSKDMAKYQVPIILSQKIASIDPPFFWLGGGEVDVKFGIDTCKFVQIFNAHIYDISE